MYKVYYWRTSGPYSLCKWGGGGGVEATGRTNYIFYKADMGPKYFSNIPYNEFITSKT